MNSEHEKELWQIRFQKILQLEQESFEFYQKLLKDKKELVDRMAIEATLKQIMQDEGRHIQIARDLLKIVDGNPLSRENED